MDEIDRSLHTKLAKFLLDEFIRLTGESNSQIIFTAHDVCLLSPPTLDREEVWFIEKNEMGESVFRPLSDFPAHEKQDTLKAYLNGRFGAVPIIGRER